MNRINQIFQHPVYQEHFQALQEAEKERIFCNHTMSHFLDVARLMYIRCLEEKAELSRDLIYAAAFLHDIGRFEQIRSGVPHDQASAELSERILPECGFSEAEIAPIVYAILSHRQSVCRDTEQEGSFMAKLLARYLYDADKKCRCCFSCPVSEECNWPAEKRNRTIEK